MIASQGGPCRAIQKLLRLAALQLICLLAFSAPAYSQISGENLETLFCPDMEDPEAYEKRNFDSYKMLIPGRDGWIFRTETDLRADFSIGRDGLGYLREIQQAFRHHGTELVFLITPTRGLVHGEYLYPEDLKKYNFTNIDKAWESYRKSINDMRKAGLAVIAMDRADTGDSFFYKRDHHWNANGARLSAQKLAAYIKAMPAYDSIEKIFFVTKTGEEKKFDGVSNKVFKKICGTDQPPEYIRRETTERIDETVRPDDLFGEIKIPDIVLLGTSNSTAEPSFANFEGALKEELSADILNMSVSGGGLDAAMIAYFNSSYYKNDPAKIAIWEIPGYYNIDNHARFFREAIPAAYGSCDNPVLEGKDILLDNKTTIALAGLASKKIYGDHHYVVVRFSEPIAKSFNLTLLYEHNRTKYRFQRSSRYPSDREYFLRLGNPKHSPLNKVVLSVPKDLIGLRVNIKICQQPGKSPARAFFIKK